MISNDAGLDVYEKVLMLLDGGVDKDIESVNSDVDEIDFEPKEK